MCCVTLNSCQDLFRFVYFLMAWVHSRQYWYPALTPQLRPGGCVCACACVCARVLDLHHRLLFFSSAAPKDRLTTSHFLCQTGFSFSTEWQNKQECCRKDCGVSSTRVHGKWNTGYYLVLNRHFWAAVQFSFLMSKNHFPLLLFPGNLQARAALWPEPGGGKTADGDKNNLGCVSSKRHTL